MAYSTPNSENEYTFIQESELVDGKKICSETLQSTSFSSNADDLFFTHSFEDISKNGAVITNETHETTNISSDLPPTSLTENQSLEQQPDQACGAEVHPSPKSKKSKKKKKKNKKWVKKP